MKTYYQLLGVAEGAPADEIKRAFRREIARYHPDKVQHLGTEFQDIAAVRASELTEAYRVLMDEAARRAYDFSLKEDAASDPSAPPTPAEAPAQEPVPAAPAEPRAAPHAEPVPPIRDSRFQKERATTNQFVRKASLSRLCEAVAAVGGSAVAVAVDGFDAAFDLNGKTGLFKKKAEAPLRLLARFAPHADAAAIEECWLPAVRGSRGTVGACLLLLGASGMAPAKELSLAVTAQRYKTRTSGPILVPVDVRDWDALFPPDAPASVRAIVQWMKQKA